MQKLQEQNDCLALQVQALESAKCLAAVQSAQTKRRMTQNRHETAPSPPPPPPPPPPETVSPAKLSSSSLSQSGTNGTMQAPAPFLQLPDTSSKPQTPPALFPRRLLHSPEPSPPPKKHEVHEVQRIAGPLRSFDLLLESPVPASPDTLLDSQDLADDLSKQVQALEQAKCLAAVQSAQTKRRMMRSREVQEENAKQRAQALDSSSWQADPPVYPPMDSTSIPGSAVLPCRSLPLELSPAAPQRLEESLPTSPTIETLRLDAQLKVAAASSRELRAVAPEARASQPRVTEAPPPQDQTYLSCGSVDAAVAAALQATEANRGAALNNHQLLSPSASPGALQERDLLLGATAPYSPVDIIGAGPLKSWLLQGQGAQEVPAASMPEPELPSSFQQNGFLASVAEVPGSSCTSTMCTAELHEELLSPSQPLGGDVGLASTSVMMQAEGADILVASTDFSFLGDKEQSSADAASPPAAAPDRAGSRAGSKSGSSTTPRKEAPKPPRVPKATEAAASSPSSGSRLPRPSSTRRPLREKAAENSAEPSAKATGSRPPSPGRQSSTPVKSSSARPKATSSARSDKEKSAAPSTAAAAAAAPAPEPPAEVAAPAELSGRSEQLAAELEDCLDTIKWSADVVKKDAVQDLRTLTHPQRAVVAVIEAAAVLIGQPTAGWERLKRLIGNATFADKVQKLNPLNVSKEQFIRLRSYLDKQTFDEEYMKEVCVPAVPLAAWCRAVGYYLSRTKFKGGPAIRPVAAAAADTSDILASDLIFEPDVTQMSEDELRQVPEFTVSRPEVGAIHFHGVVDITGIDLYRVIRLEVGEVRVYPDPADKPDVGVGLNRPATVIMYQCWPPKPLDAANEEKYRLKIKQMTEEKQATFLDYDCSAGIWKFSVEHF